MGSGASATDVKNRVDELLPGKGYGEKREEGGLDGEMLASMKDPDERHEMLAVFEEVCDFDKAGAIGKMHRKRLLVALDKALVMSTVLFCSELISIFNCTISCCR